MVGPGKGKATASEAYSFIEVGGPSWGDEGAADATRSLLNKTFRFFRGRGVSVARVLDSGLFMAGAAVPECAASRA
jgi:hypothetical protein